MESEFKQEPFTFKETLQKRGGSYYIKVPPSIVQLHNLQPDEPIKIGAFVGKHGQFIAIYKDKETQQEDINNG